VIPALPIGIEIKHVRLLRHMWRVAQGIIQRGIDPLFDRWPHRGDDIGRDFPGFVTARAPAERPTAYSPLSPRGRLPRIWNLSDAELRSLWPQLQPEDVRRWAPWAVTHNEVRRITSADGTPTELQRRVREAIDLERQYGPRSEEEFFLVESTRQPGAFHIRYPPEAMAIFGPDGLVAPPSRPREINLRTIERQFEWIRVALLQQFDSSHIVPAVSSGVYQLEEHVRRQQQRVLAIDLDRSYPQLQEERTRWFRDHVDLIESGVMAPYEEVPLRRQSLLADVQDVITRSYNQGLRVEVIAGGLRERYGVSEARAELIARDQVLKANARLTRHRQESVGVKEYIWTTARDKRVREAHARLHNTRQSWDNPPPVGGGRNEHPGGDYQCRCVARPVAPKWLVGNG